MAILFFSGLGVPLSNSLQVKSHGAPLAANFSLITHVVRRCWSQPAAYLPKLIVAEVQEEEISQGEVGQVSYFLQPVVVQH